MEISWQGTSGGENITEIQIGGGLAEWSGSQGSASIIDLTDYTLTSADGVIDVDYLDFDSDMNDAQINLKFILSDASTLSSSLTLESAGSPIPTPPMFNSCLELCTGNGYSDGTCRKNAIACTDNSEIYESGGDQYCTGGPQTDTCCCAP